MKLLNNIVHKCDCEVPEKRLGQLLFFAFLLSLVGFLLKTYLQLELIQTGLTNFSWGDPTWIHQEFYNFWNGRSFQTSVHYLLGSDQIENPFAYISQFALHMSVTPFLVSVCYYLWPQLISVYSDVFFFNLFGFLVFLTLIYNKLNGEFKKNIWILFFILSLTFSPLFFEFLNQKIVFSLYNSVFALALYYLAISYRPRLFMAVALLFLFVSDDSALFGMSLAILLMLFTFKKSFFWIFLALSSALQYFLTHWVYYPASRFELRLPPGFEGPLELSPHHLQQLLLRSDFSLIFPSLQYYVFGISLIVFIFMTPQFYTGVVSQLSKSAAHQARLLAFLTQSLLFVASQIFLFDLWTTQASPLIFSIWLVLLFNYVAVCFLQSNMKARKFLFPFAKSFALFVLFSLSHWFLYAVTADSSYGLVIYTGLVLSLLTLLIDLKNILPSKITNLAGVLIVVALFVRMGIFESNQLKQQYAHLLQHSSTELSIHNKELIEKINSLPAHASVVYWTNMELEGFLSARSDLWRFPSYYSVADYLVIQKNAIHSFFKPAPMLETKECLPAEGQIFLGLNIDRSSNTELNRALQCGRQFSQINNIQIDSTYVQALFEQLVQIDKSHIVFAESDHYLILSRMMSVPIPIPTTTLGVGWFVNVPKAFEKIK